MNEDKNVKEKETPYVLFLLVGLLIFSIYSHYQTGKKLYEFSDSIRYTKENSYNASFSELYQMINDLPEPISTESEPYNK